MQYRLDRELYPLEVFEAIEMLFVVIRGHTDWDGIQITIPKLRDEHDIGLTIDVLINE